MSKERLRDDLSLGDLVDTPKGWRGKIVWIDPRANKWPYTVEPMTGGRDDLFAAHELKKVVEEEVHPGEVLDALRVVNLEILATEEKLRGLKQVRRVLEANQLRDFREAGTV